jgi:hypothetical protein
MLVLALSGHLGYVTISFVLQLELPERDITIASAGIGDA